jgi:hypothetical protein
MPKPGSDEPRRRANLAAYERKCQSAAVLEWLGREVAKLHAELAPRKLFKPARNDGFWQTSDPAAMRMNVSALEKHRRSCEESGADAANLKQFQSSRHKFLYPTFASKFDRRMKKTSRDKKRRLLEKKRTSREKENRFPAFARRCGCFSYSFAAFVSLPTHA